MMEYSKFYVPCEAMVKIYLSVDGSSLDVDNVCSIFLPAASLAFIDVSIFRMLGLGQAMPVSTRLNWLDRLDQLSLFW